MKKIILLLSILLVSFTKILFSVRSNLPFGTRFTASHAEIIIPIKINVAIFVLIFFKWSEIYNSKVHFLWLVKIK